MPFNGSGVFQPLASPNFPAVAGTTIEATKFNANLQDIFVEGLTKCLTRDGQSPALNNLPMAGFRHTGVGDALTDDEYAAFGQVPGLRGALGIVDWDTLMLTGIYEGEASSLTGPSANFPNTSELGQLIVYQQGAIIVQTYVTGQGAFTRNKVGAVWSEWLFQSALIVDNLTLNVPADYATLDAALDFLKEKFISPLATVTIQIADGTHNFTSTVGLSHINGDRIQILGNIATPANCILRWNAATPSGTMLFTLDNATLGLMDGFTITNVTALGSASLLSAAFTLTNGARMNFGDSIVITNWQQTVDIQSGSSLVAEQLALTSNGFRGIQVGPGCVLIINPDQNILKPSTWSGFDSNGAVVGGSGSGLVIENGGVAKLFAVSMNTSRSNMIVNSGALFMAGTASISGSDSAGYTASGGSVLVVGVGVTFDSNGTWGVQHPTNGIGLYSGTIAGAGNGSGLESTGIRFSTNSIVSTNGSDLTLAPAAGGNVRFGTRVASADVPITGYIEIKDAGGTLRRLAVVG